MQNATPVLADEAADKNLGILLGGKKSSTNIILSDLKTFIGNGNVIL